MLLFHFGPRRGLGREVAHKTHSDLMLDSPGVRRPGYEVTQHPGWSILAGFDPHTSTLKPRHFSSSPVLARETAEQSLPHGSEGQKLVLTAETAIPCVLRRREDSREELRVVQVPTLAAGAGAETSLLLGRPRTAQAP